jgi:hypothetical protein
MFASFSSLEVCEGLSVGNKQALFLDDSSRREGWLSVAASRS